MAGGRTWHAAGLLDSFKQTALETELAKESADLWSHLQSEGELTGWKQCGSLYVARTPDRMMQYRRSKSLSV